MNSTEKEAMAPAQPKEKWFIDLDWLEKHHRSIKVMTESYLCAKCRKRSSQKKEVSIQNLISMIASCCGQDATFINGQQPIMESIFRIFLATGNKPLEIDQIGKELNNRRGDTYRTSPEILARLLKNDRYYGFRQAEGKAG